MQTFLPYADFAKCAQVLDDSRLGNQCYNEGITLFNGKWRDHPASKMWRGHEWYLGQYILACANELKERGKPVLWVPHYVRQWCYIMKWTSDQPVPPWLGDERVHSSHRANLLRKDPDWYGQFEWTEEPAEGYYWPVR